MIRFKKNFEEKVKTISELKKKTISEMKNRLQDTQKTIGSNENFKGDIEERYKTNKKNENKF